MTWNLDETNEDADWIKIKTWDLPTDPEAFLRVIGGRENLAHFMTLPAAKPMPQDLKAGLGLADASITVLTPDEVAGLDTLRKPQS